MKAAEFRDRTRVACRRARANAQEALVVASSLLAAGGADEEVLHNIHRAATELTKSAAIDRVLRLFDALPAPPTTKRSRKAGRR